MLFRILRNDASARQSLGSDLWQLASVAMCTLHSHVVVGLLIAAQGGCRCYNSILYDKIMPQFLDAWSVVYNADYVTVGTLVDSNPYFAAPSRILMALWRVSMRKTCAYKAQQRSIHQSGACIRAACNALEKRPDQATVPLIELVRLRVIRRRHESKTPSCA